MVCAMHVGTQSAVTRVSATAQSAVTSAGTVANVVHLVFVFMSFTAYCLIRVNTAFCHQSTGSSTAAGTDLARRLDVGCRMYDNHIVTCV